MAQVPSPIPHHVSALLSHLTSRPGVQSTLILSRKDGSIIQSTGLLALASTPINNPSRGRSTSTQDTATGSTGPTPTSPPSVTSPTSPEHTNSTNPVSPTHQQPYKPSQGEALAAHIHAFVTSASALSLSLSNPSFSHTENGYGRQSSNVNGIEGVGSIGVREDDAEAESHEREEEDEVKLLRLRTKKHEIVVVPDRKYLLCVVHDATGSSALAGGGGGGPSR